jgi:hypothetical protein
MDEGRFSISAQALYHQLGTAARARALSHSFPDNSCSNGGGHDD